MEIRQEAKFRKFYEIQNPTYGQLIYIDEYFRNQRSSVVALTYPFLGQHTDVNVEAKILSIHFPAGEPPETPIFDPTTRVANIRWIRIEVEFMICSIFF